MVTSSLYFLMFHGTQRSLHALPQLLSVLTNEVIILKDYKLFEDRIIYFIFVLQCFFIRNHLQMEILYNRDLKQYA